MKVRAKNSHAGANSRRELTDIEPIEEISSGEISAVGLCSPASKGMTPASGASRLLYGEYLVSDVIITRWQSGRCA